MSEPNEKSRADKTREVLSYTSTAIGALPDLPGVWDDAAKVGAQAIINVIRRALARGRSPEEIVTLLRGYADNPAARLELDALGERVKAELEDDAQ